MQKNILRKFKIWYLEKFHDTTKEDFGNENEVQMSKYIIIVKASFKDRVKFVFNNSIQYRLTKHQFRTINKNPLKDR